MKKNWKRIVSMLLVVAMLAAMPVVASAAAYDHVHDFTKQKTVAPTCSARGYDVYKCTKCDYTYNTNFQPSLHDYPDLENKFTRQAYVAPKDGNAGYWPYKCNFCSYTINVLNNGCWNTSDAGTTIRTLTYTDGNGNTKKVTLDKDNKESNPVYKDSSNNVIPENSFASGAIVDTKTKTITYDKNGYRKITGSETFTDGAFDTNLVDSTTKIEEITVETDAKGNTRTSTTVTNGDSVADVYKDKNGNVIASAGFKSGVETAGTPVEELVNKTTAMGSAVSGAHSYAITTVVMDGDCSSAENAGSTAGYTYSVVTCNTCNWVTVSKTAKTVAHDYPDEGDITIGGVRYKTGLEATTQHPGYAYRICTKCAYEDRVEIPRKTTGYQYGTTKAATDVYNDAAVGTLNAPNNIGQLPAGSKVLVLETKNGFSKIYSKETAWVKSDALNMTSPAAETSSCTHPAASLVETCRTEATCKTPVQIAKKCVECGQYYTFENSTTELAKGHRDSKNKVWETLTPATFKIANDTAWVITKTASATEAGEMKRVCAVCGFTETATGAKKADISAKFDYYEVASLAKLDAKKAIVTGSEIVAVYDKPSSGQKINGYLLKGSEISVTGYNAEKSWYSFNSGANWIQASNVTVNGTGSIAVSYDGADAYGVVGGVEAKVRLSYNETSSVVSSLQTGTGVVLYEKQNVSGKDWYRIGSKDADKWIQASSLTDVHDILVTYVSSKPIAKLENPIATGIVTSSIGLSIRKAASVQSEYLDKLAVDSKIYIYETKTINGVDWARIQKVEGKTAWGQETTKASLETGTELKDGWVCMTYVTLDTTIDAAPATQNQTGTVSTGGIALNVRQKADVYSNKIGSLVNGTKVTIYETAQTKTASWGRISQNSMDGWVCLQYVTLDADSSSGSSVVSAEANANVANCATGVNVRAKADVKSAQVAKIPVGTRIAITKVENKWGYVANKGWVYLDYVNWDSGAYDKVISGTVSGGTNLSENAVVTHTNIKVPAHATGNVVVYTNANTSSAQKMTLVSAEQFYIVDRLIVSGNLWYQVTQGNITGWIQNDKIVLEAVTGTIAATTANVYSEHSVDSNVTTVLGKGSKFKVEDGNANQYTEGIYAWAKIGDSQWIQLHQTSLDATVNASFEPSYTATPNITGSVIAAGTLDLKKNHDATSDVLVKLAKDTQVAITDWYATKSGTTYTTWGKMTQGQYTGWIKLNTYDTDSGVYTPYVEQTSIGGKASADVVNLYSKAGSTSANDVQMVLRSGDKVTVTERVLIGSSVWGRLVAAKDTQKRELWANLTGILLDGQTVASAEPAATVPAATTPPAAAVSTTAVGTVTGAAKVNVRSAAHVSSTLVTTLSKGTKVTVYEQTVSDGAAWGRIDQGWICMDYVNLSTNNTNTTNVSTAILSTVPDGAIAVGFTSIADVAVRSSANASSTKITALPKGTNVVIYEQTTSNGLTWGRTDNGWICTNYVVFTGVGAAGQGTAGTIARCFYTANARSAAGTNNAITGKIMVNSRIQVYETAVYSGETWGRTNVGWVAMQYVLLDSAN